MSIGYEIVVVGSLDTNCYLAYSVETRECAVIDPGADPEKIFAAIAANGLMPVILLNTHGHTDHIGANLDIKERFGIPLCIHSADVELLGSDNYLELSLLLDAKRSPAPDRLLEDGDEIKVGGFTLSVIHTPGHTPGGVSFFGQGLLFSGDTLFCGGVGRTDLAGGSWPALERSIKTRIFTLPEDTLVLPGHGPHTTVGDEKAYNPEIS